MTLTSAVLCGGAIAAQTGLPDVIVTAVRWSEDDGQTWHQGTIAAGSNVWLEFDVKNQGRGPTPAGVILGVACWTHTGGALTARSWSDYHTTPLWPGQAVSLRANGGPDGDKYWNNAASGTYTLRAFVDGPNTFPELDENNNILEVPVVVGTGIQPPPQAVAAGYTELVFHEDFLDTSGIDMADSRAAGFNFYRRRPFGWSTISTSNFTVENSILTIDSRPGTANYGIGSTCGLGGGTWRGFAARGGGYFEARIAFDPAPDPAPAGWPAFWSMAVEHLWGGVNNGYIEADFFDKYHKGFGDQRYLEGGHWWVNPSTTQSSVFTLTPPGGYNFADFHDYGQIWLPGDRWVGYRDNVSTGAHLFSSVPFLANGDTQGWPIILGSDFWPMKVDWVRVWQAP